MQISLNWQLSVEQILTNTSNATNSFLLSFAIVLLLIPVRVRNCPFFMLRDLKRFQSGWKSIINSSLLADKKVYNMDKNHAIKSLISRRFCSANLKQSSHCYSLLARNYSLFATCKQCLHCWIAFDKFLDGQIFRLFICQSKVVF